MTITHHCGDHWGYGEDLKEVSIRSYIIRTQDGLVGRNRTHRRIAEHLLPPNQQAPEKPTLRVGNGSVPGNSSEATDTMA